MCCRHPTVSQGSYHKAGPGTTSCRALPTTFLTLTIDIAALTADHFGQGALRRPLTRKLDGGIVDEAASPFHVILTAADRTSNASRLEPYPSQTDSCSTTSAGCRSSTRRSWRVSSARPTRRSTER